jgi:eukaryotic-like serine/threonine-protein kinase
MPRPRPTRPRRNQATRIGAPAPQDGPAASKRDEPASAGKHGLPADAEARRSDDARRILGRYRLEQQIAVGGMAEVWRAEDETLGRAVAVKLLHQHLIPDAASRIRFEAEARAAASLSHPGIVNVYDVSVTEDEAAIVMEYVPGEGLNDILNSRGTLPQDEALALAAQIADALDHAHRRGVIHRDVKPDNILVSAGGHARLVDFGIARVASDTAQRLTLAGTTLGTLRYMAPEQLSGEPGDERTDVFGLGATLYQMLSGRPPFDAEAPAALIRQQRARPPAIPGVDSRVMNVIWDALDADPASRPSSAGALASRLHEEEDITAAPEPPPPGDRTRIVAASGAGARPPESGVWAPASDAPVGAGDSTSGRSSTGNAPRGRALTGPGLFESIAPAWGALRRQPLGGLALLVVALLIVGAVIRSAPGDAARGPQGPTKTFRAVEDARVAIVGNTAQGAGRDNTLPVGQYQNFLYRSLIKFDPDWRGMRRIVKIELRLQTTTGVRVSRGSSPSTLVRRNVDGRWTEGEASDLTTRNSVTWTSKPRTTSQAQVRFDGPTGDNQTVTVDITQLYLPFAPRTLGGQGAENLGITLQAASDDGQTATRGDTNEFSSKEVGERGPRLIVTYEAG